MTDESRSLAERAARGDAQAIEALLARHLPDVEAYVRGRAGELVRGKESISDLVQSTCREVLLHLGRFRYDGEEGFRRWLFASALRKIRDRQRYYRAEKRDASRATATAGLLATYFRTGTSPTGAAAVRDELEQLERALAGLSASQGEVIRLAYLEELPHGAIAARLGISEAHSRVLLSRALARLARLLEGSR